MPPPPASGDFVEVDRQRRCHIYCWRKDKLSGDLNSQPKRPGYPDLWPFDLESGVRITCVVGYLCANFKFPRPLHYRLRSVTNRQTDVRRQTDLRRASSLNALGRGHNKVCIERSDGAITDLFRDCAKRVDASLHAATEASLSAAFKRRDATEVYGSWNFESA